jgi:hypothetical protein
MPMCNSSKSDGKGGNNLLTAFEVVQTLLSFGGFTIALVGLCYEIFKDMIKKSVPTFDRVGRIISVI